MGLVYITAVLSILFVTPASAMWDISAIDLDRAMLKSFSLALMSFGFLWGGIDHLRKGKESPYGFRWGWSYALAVFVGGSQCVISLSRTNDLAESLIAGILVGFFAGLIGLVVDIVAAFTWRKGPSDQSAVGHAKSVLDYLSSGHDSYSDSDYQQVAEEIERKSIDRGLWLKAQLKVDSHDEKKIQMEYVKLRLEQISRGGVGIENIGTDQTGSSVGPRSIQSGSNGENAPPPLASDTADKEYSLAEGLGGAVIIGIIVWLVLLVFG